MLSDTGEEYEQLYIDTNNNSAYYSSKLNCDDLESNQERLIC
jgi:hypothetical protein